MPARLMGLIALLFVLPSYPDPKPTVELHGKVISVTDGDTLSLLVDKQPIKIRLEGIDAPESSQAYGTKAKDALKLLAAGKDATVKKTGQDKYKRTLGVLIVGKVDVNARLVEDGWAWHYKEFNKDENLAKLEKAAREAKRGLWADENALPPWEFRHRKADKTVVAGKKSTENPPATAPKAAAPQPAAESTAKFWLNTSSNVRHNQSCQYFNNTKRGRLCSATDGKPCGTCGG